MNPSEVTNILRQFNEWQRGHNTVLRPSSNELGEAIDAAVEMIDRLEAAESEAIEQARLNGMGSEREAALMAKLEVAEKAVNEAYQRGYETGQEEIEKERDAAELMSLALRAKVEQMERQEPVAFALYIGWAFKAAYHKEHEACDQRDRRQLSADLGGSLEAYRVVPLYALPGAQLAPSVPDTYAAGINAVAAMLQSKADEYAKEYGHDDMGGLSFGPGMGGEIKMDYYTNLIELVDDVRAMLADAPEAKP